MKKKVAVVSVADAEEAARLADLPLEATVALAEVAGAIKDGLLAFASATGLVVMRQMMAAELTEAIGQKHAKIRGRKSVSATGTATPRARSCSAGVRSAPSARGAGPPPGPRSSSTPGRPSARPTCSTRSSSSACWPGWPPGATTDVAEPVGEELEAAVQVHVQVGRLPALRGGDHQGHG